MNPQQMMQTSAYFTYYIPSQVKVMPNRRWGIEHVATMMYTVALQCVGLNSEELIQSTLFWDEREDIRLLLAEYDTQLFNNRRTVISVPYFQDGNNTVLSHNVELRFVSHLTEIEEHQGLLKEAILNGGLWVEGERYE